MFDSVTSLFKWFKEHFREPPPGGLTPGTPRLSSGRTPYGSGTPSFSKYINVSGTLRHLMPICFIFSFFLGMSTEAIQRVAQNLPSHMVQALSAATNQTPHYPHTPGGYGANYINTVSLNYSNYFVIFNYLVCQLMEKMVSLLRYSIVIWGNLVIFENFNEISVIHGCMSMLPRIYFKKIIKRSYRYFV